ncbi:MAG: VCBS repeat-containing protein, partial [Verrucomicrobiales bacterium]|nr:VCBS repeat-containing protein [Verrucomicrobiales bacterium]
MVTADFDHDGHLDLVIADFSQNSLVVWVGGGDGSFVMRTNLTVPTSPWAVASGDLNADHQLDLLVGGWRSDEV